MKKIPFEQLKSIFSRISHVQPQSRYCRNLNPTMENDRTLCSACKLDGIKIPYSAIHTATNKRLANSGVLLNRNFSFFSRKKRNLPIKCKIRTNECGEEVAETYIADKPSHISFPPHTMDVPLNLEETCKKLQADIVTTSSPTNYRSNKPQNYLCPNALTKYFKIKRKCEEVHKGSKTNECNRCELIQKNTYTGKDCKVEDPCKTDVTEPQTEQPRTKKVLESLISKLKSKKMLKSSGFFDEELLEEACTKLRGSKKLLTYVRNTSNQEKSPQIDLGVQNSCRFHSSGVSFLKTLENEEADVKNLFGGMSRDIRSRKIEDIAENDPEISDKDGTKLKNTSKKIKNKSKNRIGIRRRRKRTRWFSRIPIEPNVKGSVIFVDGNTQQLDDPCKILSVNFSDSTLPPIEDKVEVKSEIKHSESLVQNMMNKYDNLVQKLTTESVVKRMVSAPKEEESKNQQKVSKNYKYYKQKETKIKQIKSIETEDTGDITQKLTEPILRQKKISKLDNTVKCLTATMLPEKQPQPKKRQKKISKHSKSDLKQGSVDNLDTPLLDLKNYPSTASSEAFGKGLHAFTTNNLLIDFNKGTNSELNRRNNVGVANSASSFVKIKEISPMFESGDEKEATKSFPKNLLQKHHQLLPGLTRPVTQKAAYLNLLESNVATPVSNAWKKNCVHPGKMKDKRDQKKALGITNKPELTETKGVNYQQQRMKSTTKAPPSKCSVHKKPCQERKKNYDGKVDDTFPLDWDYEARVPDEIARRWYNFDCSKRKDAPCPITNEDLKKVPPHRNPPSAASINRCNLEECKQRLRCKKSVSRCKNIDNNREK